VLVPACWDASRTTSDGRACGTCIRAGNSENVVMKLTGHKTRAVLDRYDIVSPSDLREAAAKRNVTAIAPASPDSGVNQGVNHASSQEAA